MRLDSVLCVIVCVILAGCSGESTPTVPDMDFGGMSVEQLVDSLDHENGRVRYLAVQELGDRGPAAASVLPALSQRLKDDDADVRLSTTTSLARIFREVKRPFSPEAEAAVAALRVALLDEDENVRKGARMALLMAVPEEIGSAEIPEGIDSAEILGGGGSGFSDTLAIVLLVVIALAFTAFAALVFSLLTIILGKFWSEFEISGPEGWRFIDFYWRYLIIAAVYTFVSIPLKSGFLGIAALAVAYKYVFDAGWTQAIVIGIVGGIVALVLFFALVLLLLVPFGLFI